MFKKGSYNVKKASETEEKKKEQERKKKEQEEKKKEQEKKKKMELKKKEEIRNLNAQESPEYHKKSHSKNVTTNKRQVENKTFKTKQFEIIII